MLSTEREYRLGILSITVVSFQLQVFIFFLTPQITPFHQDAKEKDVDKDNPPNSKMFDSTRERNTDDVALLAKRRLAQNRENTAPAITVKFQLSWVCRNIPTTLCACTSSGSSSSITDSQWYSRSSSSRLRLL